jgi:putative intracellular protease/amidase
MPDTDASGVDAKKAAMLILPGSTLYEEDDPTELVPLVRDFLANDIPVAAICGATLFLAKHGFLDAIPHTSSGAKWLKARAPQYKGERHYIPAPCVASGNIITANPAGFVEFAAEIMKRLEVFPPGLLDMVMGTLRTGYMDADLFEG